jgi:intracellular sulfur oxidation DsrE/DsrF family protein
MPDPQDERSTVVLITNNGLGKSDEKLQHMLAQTYFRLIHEHDLLPAAICFYTEGVRLVVEGSPVLDTLAALEAKGVRLIVCSTCLNYLGLNDMLRVGIVGGMTDILEAQWKAEKVITL